MQGRDATRRRDVRTLYYTPMSAKDAAREAERGTGHAARSAPASENSADAVNAHYDTRLPELPWSRRIQNPVIAPTPAAPAAAGRSAPSPPLQIGKAHG